MTILIVMPVSNQFSKTSLHPVLHALLLASAVVFAYWWLQTPSLQYYSLQAFSVAVIGYFLLKRLSRSKIWHLIPAHSSLEMVRVL